jgi:hypothetical protein
MNLTKKYDWVTSSFRHGGNEIFALLGCYAALVFTDVLRQPVGSIVTGQAVQEDWIGTRGLNQSGSCDNVASCFEHDNGLSGAIKCGNVK